MGKRKDVLLEEVPWVEVVVEVVVGGREGGKGCRWIAR